VALLALPATFLTLVVLKYYLGVGYPFDALEGVFVAGGWQLELFNSVSPLLFLGGLLLAVALNAAAMVRGSLSLADDGVTGSLTVRPRLANLVVILAAGLMLVTFAGYGLAENWDCLAGSARSC
jgi:hypothetical protein